jgi:hypothetical protein
MEKNIESYLRRRVHQLGGLAAKWVSPNLDGVPDRIVLLPGGRAAFAELKDKGKKPTKKQAYRHRQIEALGFAVYIADSYEAVDRAIAHMTGQRTGGCDAG